MQIFGGMANKLNSFGLAYLQHIIDGTVVVIPFLYEAAIYFTKLSTES